MPDRALRTTGSRTMKITAASADWMMLKGMPAAAPAIPYKMALEAKYKATLTMPAISPARAIRPRPQSGEHNLLTIAAMTALMTKVNGAQMA